jgi:hypothetical protein
MNDNELIIIVEKEDLPIGGIRGICKLMRKDCNLKSCIIIIIFILLPILILIISISIPN